MGPAATDQPHAPLRPGGHLHQFMSLQGIPLEIDHLVERGDAAVNAADEDRAFGEAVSRDMCLAPEATGAKDFHKPLQRLPPNRLRPVQRTGPAAQIQRLHLLGGHLTHAEFIGEVRGAAIGAPVVGDRLQPAEGALHEGGWGHENRGEAHVDRLENPHDQAHVVVGRNPAHPHALGRVPQPPPDRLQVLQQVPMGQHDPLGVARGAGGVLQEGKGIGGQEPLAPGVPFAGVVIDGDPLQGFQGRPVRHKLAGPGQDLFGGQGNAGGGVVYHGLEPVQIPVHAGRVGRNGNRPGVEAAEEGCDIGKPGRVEQQHPLPLRPRRHESGSDGTGPPVQLCV